MENPDVVNEPLTTEQTSEVTQEDETTEEVNQPVLAGDKTPPNELLGALQKERDTRRDAEAKSKRLEEELEDLKKSSLNEDEVFSDEGKALQKQIKDTQVEIASLRKESAKKDLLISNPAIREHLKEFEEFQDDPENKGMNLRTAAKAFMIEKGLIGSTPRVGLEKATGGDKTVSTSGKMTSADAELLRTTNFRKYQEMLVKDQIHLID